MKKIMIANQERKFEQVLRTMSHNVNAQTIFGFPELAAFICTICNLCKSLSVVKFSVLCWVLNNSKFLSMSSSWKELERNKRLCWCWTCVIVEVEIIIIVILRWWKLIPVVLRRSNKIRSTKKMMGKIRIQRLDQTNKWLLAELHWTICGWNLSVFSAIKIWKTLLNQNYCNVCTQHVLHVCQQNRTILQQEQHHRLRVSYCFCNWH